MKAKFELDWLHKTIERMSADAPYVCPHCFEIVQDQEPFRWADQQSVKLHLECILRLTFGSVGHQLQLCTCFGGVLGDPPAMSPREAARSAALLSVVIHGGDEAHLRQVLTMATGREC